MFFSFFVYFVQVKFANFVKLIGKRAARAYFKADYGITDNETEIEVLRHNFNFGADGKKTSPILIT